MCETNHSLKIDDISLNQEDSRKKKKKRIKRMGEKASCSLRQLNKSLAQDQRNPCGINAAPSLYSHIITTTTGQLINILYLNYSHHHLPAFHKKKNPKKPLLTALWGLRACAINVCLWEHFFFPINTCWCGTEIIILAVGRREWSVYKDFPWTRSAGECYLGCQGIINQTTKTITFSINRKARPEIFPLTESGK